MNAPSAIEAPMPRIAVIVPAYGLADLVGEAVESVLAQTFADWECWIIDDGSPDDVAAAVAPYLGDPRIRLLATDNGGVSRARNLAIARTRAPYLALLDADDLLRPRYLERMVAALDAQPDARFVTCNARKFGAVPKERFCAPPGQRGRGMLTGSLAEVLDRRFNVYIGSAFRRADWERVGGFDESMAHCEDFDFWLRLLIPDGHGVYLDEVLGEYRVRPHSVSAQNGKMIHGLLRAYAKALPRLRESDAAIAATMFARNEEHLAFEQAVERVLVGDTQAGIATLRRLCGEADGFVWPAALALWGVVPALAAPMLRWRRRAHARKPGYEVAPLGPAWAEMTT